MKARWVLITIAATLMVFVGSRAFAQDNNNDKKWDKEHPMFNQQEHEFVKKWWSEHQNNPPEGLRPEDKLPPDLEAQLKPGFILDQKWRDERVHHMPASLVFHLRKPPIPYVAYLIGGHLVLVNHTEWRVADIINVTD